MTCFSHLPSLMPLLEGGEPVRISLRHLPRKTRGVGLWWKSHNPNFNRFWLIRQCDRQTRTDGRCIYSAQISLLFTVTSAMCDVGFLAHCFSSVTVSELFRTLQRFTSSSINVFHKPVEFEPSCLSLVHFALVSQIPPTGLNHTDFYVIGKNF